MLKANCCKRVLVVVLLVSIVSTSADAQPFRFTVSCDNRPVYSGNIPRWEWLLDEMSDKVGDEGVFHIIPGDFDDPQYTDASLILQFGEDVVWYPVVGNHESETPADMEWIRNAYYSLPYIVKEGPAGCETTTYSWDYGNAHFIAINEYYDGISDTGTDGDVVDELYDWLVSDLEANTQPFVFVIGHEPAYPEYRHVGDSLDQYPANRDRFWKLLNDEQVVAYFCGHTHYFYAKQVDGPDWEPFTWQVDTGNAGNPGEACQTFVDVTVTETEVIFNTWQGTQNSPFTNIESWTVGISYKAYRPKPGDGAVHPETWATLSWTIGFGAASHDVYFGENFDDVNDGTGGTFRGNQTETSFAVGSPESAYQQALVPGVTYYWRIDEVNDLDPNSPWKGDVWSFTTAPGYATQPDPANNAVGVAIDATLSWLPGLTAATRDVYFGTSSPPPFIRNQAESSYDPGPLEVGTTYYWRIDEIEADGTTIYTGDIWSFTTAPGYATQPDPANDGFVVVLDTTLSWLPGPTAATHDVYFGTSSPPPFIGNQTAASFDPGPLEFGTTYYWRIDEVEADGTTVHTGDIWSFTTLFDVTAPGDTVQGVPDDGDWPGNEAPPLAIDDNVNTKYLHFKGDFDPDPGTGGAGLRVTPLVSQSVVTALTFTTANDFAGRDPVAFELSGSNVSIDGPYTLIASGDIVDFAQAAEWPRFTKNETPISFDNEVAYDHYQVLFTAIRGGSGQWINSMQIAEVELLGITRNAWRPSPADGATNVSARPTLSWLPGVTAASHDVYFGDSDPPAFIGNQTETSYSPGSLDKGKTYYWRVDEVEADGTTKYKGGVWSFTTSALGR